MLGPTAAKCILCGQTMRGMHLVHNASLHHYEMFSCDSVHVGVSWALLQIQHPNVKLSVNRRKERLIKRIRQAAEVMVVLGLMVVVTTSTTTAIKWLRGKSRKERKQCMAGWLAGRLKEVCTQRGLNVESAGLIHCVLSKRQHWFQSRLLAPDTPDSSSSGHWYHSAQEREVWDSSGHTVHMGQQVLLVIVFLWVSEGWREEEESSEAQQSPIGRKRLCSHPAWPLLN